MSTASPSNQTTWIPPATLPSPFPPPRLTDLADGQVLSASFWHVLSDGGRALRLLARLSEHYRVAAAGQPVGGEPMTSDTRLFHSPADLMQGMAAE